MNVYVFKDVMQLTDRYHCEGGLVVVAKDKTEATKIIERANNGLIKGVDDDYRLASADIALSEEDWDNVIIYPTDETVEPAIYVFPDAGCC